MIKAFVLTGLILTFPTLSKDHSLDRKYSIPARLITNSGQELEFLLTSSYPTFEEMKCQSDDVFLFFSRDGNKNTYVVAESDLNKGEDDFIELAELAINESEEVKALSDLEFSIELNYSLFSKDDSDSKFSKALTLIDEGQYEEAEKLLKAIDEIDQLQSCVQMAYGSLYSDQSLYEQSLPYYEKAVELSPNNERLYYSLAWRLNKLHRTDEAIELLNKMLSIHNAYWEPYYLLNDIYHDQGDYLKAIHYSTLGLDFRDDTYFNELRGWDHLNNDNFRLALIDFQKVIDEDPENIDGYRGKSQVLDNMGRHEDGLKVIDDAMNHMEMNQSLYIEKAMHMDGLERFEEAIENYSLAIEKFGPDDTAINNLGYTLTKKGDLKEAINVLQTAFENGIETQLITNNLATAYYLRGQYRKSNNYFQLSLNSFVHENLSFEKSGMARNYIHLGKVDEAFELMQQVVQDDPYFVDAYIYYKYGKDNDVLDNLSQLMKLSQELNRDDLVKSTQGLMEMINE
jgi:tetratricopeptide (TPR) repeat protein